MRSTDRPRRAADAREQVVLRSCVQRGRRLVEHDERRVAEERPRERDALPLADRDVLAALKTGPSIVSYRSGHSLMKTSAPARSAARDDRVGVVDPLDAPEADVLARGEHEAREVLEEHRDAVEIQPGSRVEASTPSHSTRPASGGYRPQRTLASVVFPEPFSPTSAMTSPLRISKDTSDSAARAGARIRRARARVCERHVIELDPLEGLPCRDRRAEGPARGR